ncbi:conserved hypothetical protein [Thiomonas sp. X19]|uniref:DUF2252 domain-containing protein n=1 Tax=Thiomonas sp. X19 TaxID=1050370 RepID=UPI000B6EC0A1|nr:DUF2252 family protein [Thiomonas sp. X19]SCC93779.1 conserved hypothetical protein [Thiomonas sp. X19]
MIDPVRAIRSFNAGRDPERLALKYRAMRQSRFAFLRGSCHLFHDRLPAAKLFTKAPTAWLCGDLHLENFGSYKGDNRLVYFDLNDFDEALLGSLTLDLVRALTSILVGADVLHAAQDEALDLGRRFLDAYTQAILDGNARWVERETAHGRVRQLLGALQDRARPAFLDTRTVRKGKRRLLRVDGQKALPASDEQREQVTALLAEFAAAQAHPEFYTVLDVARRIAGTGSLGVDRYVILVQGKGSPDANYLLDLKQALPSALAGHVATRQPKWASHAHRVVGVQQRMQAVSMAFLRPLKWKQESYVLRGLQPSEDRVALDRTQPSMAELEGVIRTMGRLTAWAQLRSSGRGGSATTDELQDFAAGRKWGKTLMAAAQDCARQCEQDWKAFAAAFDAGGFKG